MIQVTFRYFILYAFLILPLSIEGLEANPIPTYDIVIYGGTSSGVLAAAQAAEMGKSVILIEPGNHLGGMTSSGLGWVDISNSKTIGGLTRKYFNNVWNHYEQDSSWIWESKHPIKGQLYQFHPKDLLMWALEPHVGEMIFNKMISESNVPVVFNERLNRGLGGVRFKNKRIIQIFMESRLTFKGKMFIDASYEGDLMAASNVSYIVGREPNSLYHETLNGIHKNPYRINNPLLIDPFRVRGKPESGLLPRICPHKEREDGEGDRGVQAYTYRMCLTDVPQNRVPIEKPKAYDESQYEILFRAIETSPDPLPFFKLDLVPNRKTDSNNKGLISTDYIGMSWRYPEASYKARKQIALDHEKWQRGLIWTLQNHPRIPLATQKFYAPWGLPKDEFLDNNHWPYMLYIREARRMISSVVITEDMALGNVPVQDSIGLAYYSMDSHAIKYVVNSQGILECEGGMFKHILKPFPISYQVIVPQRHECENLLVPVCLSASHVGYGTIRVEPIFMILGQSAATAASLAIDLNVPLQDLPYDILQDKLLLQGQILKWDM